MRGGCGVWGGEDLAVGVGSDVAEGGDEFFVGGEVGEGYFAEDFFCLFVDAFLVVEDVFVE